MNVTTSGSVSSEVMDYTITYTATDAAGNTATATRIVHVIPWIQMPGLATDIGTSVNGVVWVLGIDPVPGGYTPFKWNGSDWDSYPGGLTRITVDPFGNAWGINDDNTIYRWNGSGWEGLPGQATDIGVGADGTVWIIGTNAVAGGYGIYKWNGSNWDGVSGGGVGIAVRSNGYAWIVNTSNEILRYTEER